MNQAHWTNMKKYDNNYDKMEEWPGINLRPSAASWSQLVRLLSRRFPSALLEAVHVCWLPWCHWGPNIHTSPHQHPPSEDVSGSISYHLQLAVPSVHVGNWGTVKYCKLCLQVSCSFCGAGMSSHWRPPSLSENQWHAQKDWRSKALGSTPRWSSGWLADATNTKRQLISGKTYTAYKAKHWDSSGAKGSQSSAKWPTKSSFDMLCSHLSEYVHTYNNLE